MTRLINKAKVTVNEDKLEVLVEKIMKALSKSHRFFGDILDLFPDEAYGRIARAVGWLNEKARITQDTEGKYQLVNHLKGRKR